MANKKVSQLSATTEANNGVWLIMNNSGNTETFRIKREDLLSGTTSPAGFIQGDASQSLVPYYFPTSSGTTSATTYVDNLKVSGGKVEVSKDLTNNTLNQSNLIVVGRNNSSTSSNNSPSVIIGNNNTNTANRGVNDPGSFILGYNNIVGGGGTADGNFVTGYSNNANGRFSTIIAGDNSNNSGNYSVGLALNSKNHSGNWSLYGGGYAGHCVNSDNTILWGANNSSDNYDKGISVGSLHTTNYSEGSAVFGYDNDILGTSVSKSNYNSILGGTGHTISNGVNYSTIISGYDNVIPASAENVVIIGLTDYTASTNNTTYTQNHASLGQTYNGYYDNLSGDTFTIDWDNGNSQKVYMTGNTTFDFTNVRNGATYKLQVVNGGTHSITGATASGYTILCEGGNIPNITNNGVDLCILEVMGTDILVRHFADFSAP